MCFLCHYFLHFYYKGTHMLTRTHAHARMLFTYTHWVSEVIHQSPQMTTNICISWQSHLSAVFNKIEKKSNPISEQHCIVIVQTNRPCDQWNVSSKLNPPSLGHTRKQTLNLTQQHTEPNEQLVKTVRQPRAEQHKRSRFAKELDEHWWLENCKWMLCHTLSAQNLCKYLSPSAKRAFLDRQTDR